MSIECLKRLIAARPDVIGLAVVFGSTVTGRASKQSDLDLAVRWSGGGPADRIALLAAIERAVGRTLDVIEIDDAPPQLRFEIARHGKVVVDHDRVWTQLKARAFVDWWDFRPIALRIQRAAVARLRQRVHGPA